MLRVEELSFRYDADKRILNQIGFDLKEGQMLAVVGNNGSGKSTLLRCLNRILKFENGKVFVGEEDLAHLDRQEIARMMAYLPQNSRTVRLNVFDAVLLGRKPYFRVDPRPRDVEIAQRVIRRLELQEFAASFLDELSGGEEQKVLLARALVQEPKVMLLDEPTSKLDLYNQHESMRLLRQSAKKDGIAVIVVLHDLNLALRYCDRFLFLKAGQIEAYGDVEIINTELICDVFGVEAELIKTSNQHLLVIK